MYNKELKNKTNKPERSNEDKQKEVKKRRNFNLPGFINSDGVVVAMTIGVKVPLAESNRAEDKKMMLEMALRNFKTKVKDSGILDLYKAKQEFIKPSVKKRQMKKEAIRREYLNNLNNVD
jgi:ribosomal protein S21